METASLYPPTSRSDNNAQMAGFLTCSRNRAFPSCDSDVLRFRWRNLQQRVLYRIRTCFPLRILRRKSFTTLRRQRYIFSEHVEQYMYWRIPIRALANSCTGVGEFLHRRWRIPAPALTNSCTGVDEFLHRRWQMPARALTNDHLKHVETRRGTSLQRVTRKIRDYLIPSFFLMSFGIPSLWTRMFIVL